MIQFPTQKINPFHATVLYNAEARINILDGSVRSGKTIDAIFKFVMQIGLYPKQNGLYLITGKTMDAIERNILIPISGWLPSHVFRYSKAGRYAIFSNNDYDIKIHLIGANDEKSESKIRGSTIFIALCDELTLYPESFFRMLDRGLSLDNSILIGTTNPDNPKHWLKVNYIDRKHELDLFYQKFTIYDNPYLSKSVIKNLEKNFTGLWKKRFIFGEWVASSGSVYGDSFNEDIHVIDTSIFLEKCIKYYVSIDYGINNPCTFGFFGKSGGGVIYLFAEYYWDSNSPECQRQKGVNEYLKDLNKFIEQNLPKNKKLNKIFVDPSALDFINLINNDKQISSKAVIVKDNKVVGKGKNSVLSGIQLVTDYFIKNKFFIDKKAKHSISETISYSWDDKAIEDKPKKYDDHTCDMIRYLIASTHHIINSSKIIMSKR